MLRVPWAPGLNAQLSRAASHLLLQSHHSMGDSCLDSGFLLPGIQWLCPQSLLPAWPCPTQSSYPLQLCLPSSALKR